jgi:hypothetical protein
MNIMFMKAFPDGSPTDFENKINKCLNNEELTLREKSEMLVTGMVPKYVHPKLHTMRPITIDKDGNKKPCRIRVGMGLSLRNWAGKPYRSGQYAFADTRCRGVQAVVIVWGPKKDRVNVVVDGIILDKSEVELLARNDGFESVEDFFKWFDNDFEGWIIHWTDKKYGVREK